MRIALNYIDVFLFDIMSSVVLAEIENHQVTNFYPSEFKLFNRSPYLKIVILKRK